MTVPSRSWPPLTLEQIDKQLELYSRQLSRTSDSDGDASVTREHCLLHIDALLDQRFEITNP